jgi:uncharacterized membrane protein
MPTKKAQSKAPAKAQSNDAAAFWKWLYVAGILVASLAGAFGFSNPILTIVLILVGILVGLFYFDSSDLMNFGLRFLIVTAAAGALSALPFVGAFLTGFFTAFAAFLGPVVLAMALMFFWKKYFGSM